jgi:hypothetical protein
MSMIACSSVLSTVMAVLSERSGRVA